MKTHDLAGIPDGFRPVLWAEVTTGEMVSLQEGPSNLRGPFRVVDPLRRQICSIGGEAFTYNHERLLYRKGPLVVAHYELDGVLTLYSDIPLEVYYADNQLDLWQSWRALPLEALPDKLNRQLNEDTPTGWTDLYGTWDVVSAVAADNPKETMIEFVVEQRLIANALCTELLRESLPFQCQPLEPDSYVFILARKALDHITKHLQQLLPRGTGVNYGSE